MKIITQLLIYVNKKSKLCPSALTAKKFNYFTTHLDIHRYI